MGVVHCWEVTPRDGSADKREVKRYTRVWQVYTDSPTDGAKLVRTYPGLPAMKSVWQQIGMDGVTVEDTDTDTFLVQRAVKQDDADNFQNWTVTDEYVGRGSPTLEPAEISWSTTKYQKALQKDLTSPTPLLIANSAGDPFEAGVVADRSRFTLTISKNVLVFDPQFWAEYVDSLNDFSFLTTSHPPGFAPGTCKLSDVSADAVWYESDAAIHFWKLLAKVEVNLDTWDAEVLDAGYHQKLTVLGVPLRVPIHMPGGGKPSSPQPLDGAGLILATAGTPVYKTFILYPSRDWAALELEY